jgi:sigma-B regulation protein RsbQ
MNILQRNNVQTVGDPTAPVLLYGHGFGCDQTMWNQITPAFQHSHFQLLFDYVGSGQSDISAYDAGRYATLQGYAQDIIEICAALGLTKNVVFVGHSVSCSIGILAAIARPGLFSNMILLGPSPCFFNDPPHYFGGFEPSDLHELLDLMQQNYLGWANYLAPVIAGDGGTISGRLSESFCSTHPLVMKQFAKATFFADNREDFAKVATPCLVLQHKQDALASVAVGEFVHRQLKNSELVVLDVAGHVAHMSHPQLVIDAMSPYLAAQGGGGYYR